MTKDEAIEICARAMLRRRSYREETWRDYPQAEMAADIVAALEARGRRSQRHRRSLRSGTHARPAGGRCGSTRRSAPQSRPASRG
jgi:hypothetical protein